MTDNVNDELIPVLATATTHLERMVAYIRAGDAEQAALEMEEHLRILQVMSRLATPSALRASA